MRPAKNEPRLLASWLRTPVTARGTGAPPSVGAEKP